MRPFVDLGVDCFLLDCGGFPRLTTVETLARALSSGLLSVRIDDRASVNG